VGSTEAGSKEVEGPCDSPETRSEDESPTVPVTVCTASAAGETSCPVVADTTEPGSPPAVVDTTETGSTPVVVDTTETGSTPVVVDTTETGSTPDVRSAAADVTAETSGPPPEPGVGEPAPPPADASGPAPELGGDGPPPPALAVAAEGSAVRTAVVVSAAFEVCAAAGALDTTGSTAEAAGGGDAV
jgi:hypothetical protein